MTDPRRQTAEEWAAIHVPKVLGHHDDTAPLPTIISAHLAGQDVGERRERKMVTYLRSVLMELRIRLHAMGRRPEECHEMSIIDDALALARGEHRGEKE